MRARQSPRNRYVLTGNADEAAAKAPIANQLRRDVADRVARQREAESLRIPDHRGVDSDDFTACRHERTAGIAGIERRVGLNHIVDDAA